MRYTFFLLSNIRSPTSLSDLHHLFYKSSSILASQSKYVSSNVIFPHHPKNLEYFGFSKDFFLQFLEVLYISANEKIKLDEVLFLRVIAIFFKSSKYSDVGMFYFLYFILNLRTFLKIFLFFLF